MAIRIVDVTDDASFALLPPCADPGFDHRSCDYWEDADRGSKAARLSWIQDAQRARAGGAREGRANPFARDDDGPAFNPFAPASTQAVVQPVRGRRRRAGREPVRAQAQGTPGRRAVRARPKLRLLGRGLTVFGSYAKVLLRDDEPAAYAQFGPLSAYPRAIRTRELYPRLPDAPLPAVITCISTTPAARRQGLAAMLVEAVCDDLAARGFAAVETYPEVGAKEDATSAAQPAFWERLGFVVAAPDERFPVLRRELA